MSSRSRQQATNPRVPHLEVNLSGQGHQWDVSFSATMNLSDAITFRRGFDDAGFAATSRHTLSIFHDGTIKFRDSQSVDAMRPNTRGRMRSVQLAIWAAVEITPDMFKVIRHEEDGQRWITLIKLRPGHIFKVQQSPFSPSYPPTTVLGHHMVRLWTQRQQIERTQYLTIVLHDYKNYGPWNIVLHKRLLGPVVGGSAPAPVTNESEPEPLTNLSEEPATAPAASETDNPDPEPPSAEPSEQTPADPFRSVWEHARSPSTD
jgi:hypothetical protein